MKNNLLGKHFFSFSFYLYRFRNTCPIINFCNPGEHFETPCISQYFTLSLTSGTGDNVPSYMLQYVLTLYALFKIQRAFFNTLLNLFNSIPSGKLLDPYFRCHFRPQLYYQVLGAKLFLRSFLQNYRHTRPSLPPSRN